MIEKIIDFFKSAVQFTVYLILDYVIEWWNLTDETVAYLQYASYVLLAIAFVISGPLMWILLRGVSGELKPMVFSAVERNSRETKIIKKIVKIVLPGSVAVIVFDEIIKHYLPNVALSSFITDTEVLLLISSLLIFSYLLTGIFKLVVLSPLMFMFPSLEGKKDFLGAIMIVIKDIMIPLSLFLNLVALYYNYCI